MVMAHSNEHLAEAEQELVAVDPAEKIRIGANCNVAPVCRTILPLTCKGPAAKLSVRKTTRQTAAAAIRRNPQARALCGGKTPQGPLSGSTACWAALPELRFEHGASDSC